MLARRHFLQRMLWLLPALAPVAAGQARPKRRAASAASPAPEPSPSGNPNDDDAKKKEAASAKSDKPEKPAAPQMRFWKGSDLPEPDLKIRLRPADQPKAEGVSLPVLGQEYNRADYADVPAGAAEIEITAPDCAPLRLPVYLVNGSLSTLLVRQHGGNLSVDWIDDTPRHFEDGAGELNIYNLLAGGGELQVSLGDALNVRLTAARGSLRLGGMKRAQYPVSLVGGDADGKTFRWNSEVDFRHCRKASLLVALDSYGRVRPRMNIDA